MDLVHQAFNDLYPDKVLLRKVSVRYSGRFKPFNANVRYGLTFLEFNLSKSWKSVSPEIQIGLIQSLLVKIFPRKRSRYIDLYDSFVRNLSVYAPKVHSDPVLDESFDRVNQKFFSGLLDKPNLKWGSFNASKLGSYEYQSDTVVISSLFKMIRNEILDYIMYHELLHKKHKFYTTKTGRNFHHTRAFRDAEKRYPNHREIEKELNSICRKARFKKFFWF